MILATDALTASFRTLLHFSLIFRIFVTLYGLLLMTVFVCLQQLMNNLDRDLQYAIKVEGKMDLENVTNYNEVKNAITEKVMCLSIIMPKGNIIFFF